MSNYDLEEDNLIKIQIFLSFIFIISLLISISLSINSMSKYRNKIYNDDLLILRINRIISLVVALGFLLINIIDKDIKEKYNKNYKYSDLQIIASFITLTSSLIVLYIAFSSTGNIIGNENPEI